jgi:hypothetical protein
MFEKAISVPGAQNRKPAMPDLRGEMLVGNRDSVPGRGGDAMRAIGWSELTARLNAARDLRLVLRRDAGLSIHTSAASFGDAAATYFQSLENGERPVNPVALERSKASCGKAVVTDSFAATGDAREKQ